MISPTRIRATAWVAAAAAIGVAACEAPPPTHPLVEIEEATHDALPEPPVAASEAPSSIHFGMFGEPVALMQTAAPNPLAASLRILDLLNAPQSGGAVGFYLRELGGSTHLAFNHELVFEPASTIKALTHFHAMRQVQDEAVIDGEVVTVNTMVDWFGGPSNYSNNPEEGSGDTSCPDLSTLPRSNSLWFVLSTMMANSDNRTTEAARQFFGADQVDATRIQLGMDNSLHQHVIGCAAAANDNPNRLTLVDAGRLYEAAATTYLDDATRTTAFDLMVRDNGIFNTIVSQEAAGLGISPGYLAQFRNLRDAALKPGGYGVASGTSLSVAGWSTIPFRTATCELDPREFVWGAFISEADEVEEDTSIRALGAEVLREQIRWALETWRDCEADLAVDHVAFEAFDNPQHVNVPFSFTVRTTVGNLGPASPVDAILVTSVSAPSDCALVQPSHNISVPALAMGESREVDVVFQATCSEPSFHLFEAESGISTALLQMRDPVFSNNWRRIASTRELIAYADLGVEGMDLSGLDAAQVGDIVVGHEFAFGVTQTVRNQGDTELGVYFDPADARVSRGLTLPDGVEASVVVDITEPEAEVVIQRPGEADEVFSNVAPGSRFTAAGPATIAVISRHTLAVDAVVQLQGEFALECTAPGERSLTFTGAIEAVDPHLLDPAPADNTVEELRQIDCALPVQVNIRPGNAFNRVNPGSSEVVPVAILTTEAGEYGLPMAFDAATLDPTSTRFGTAAMLTAGGGSSAQQDFLRDSFEKDDQTRDGDLDRVQHFPIQGTGVEAGTTELLVRGRFLGSDGNWYSFVGRDSVQVQGS
jgi:hypothetical protein